MVIKVCIGSACHLKGSYDIIHEFQKVIKEYHLEDEITLKGAFCMNKCTKGVSTEIDNEIISMSPSQVRDYMLKVIEVKKWNT